MTEKKKRRYSYMEKFLLLALLEGDLTSEGAREKLRSLIIHFGAWHRLEKGKFQKQFRKIDPALQHLLDMGTVTETEGTHRLTEAGKTDASELHRGVVNFALKTDDFFSNAETASKFSAFVNAILSALMLVAGFLSNSMGLIADGIDNLIDTLSSVASFFGVKYKKEIHSTVLIVGLMFFASITLGYQAVFRFIHPEVIEVGFWPIFIAAISGVICYLMSLYQHLVGKRYKSLTVMAQSIDNKHHAILSGAVLIGLVCARFGVVIVDSVMSLVVAILILRSAIELSLEAYRAARGADIEFSKFKADYEPKLQRYQQNYFKTWTLSELRDFKSKDDLSLEFQRAFTMKGVPLVHEFDFSLSRRFDYETCLDAFLTELFADGHIVEMQERFLITRSGEKELSKQSKPRRQRLAELMKGNRFELKVDSKLENLIIISDFTNEALKQLGIDLATIFKVQMAVDEACANIIENGYTKEESGSISITCRKPRNDLMITIKDKGKPLGTDFISSASPEIALADIDECELGRLGIYLIKRLMEDVSYDSNSKTGNELVMIKHLSQTDGK